MQQPTSSKQRERQTWNQPLDTTGTPVNPADSTKSASEPRLSKSQRRQFLRRYIAWLWPFKWQIGFVLGLAVFVAALDLTWPLAIKLIIDTLTATVTGTPAGKTPAWSAHLHGFLGLGIFVILLLLIKQSLDSFRSYRIAVLNNKVIFRLRRMLFERLIRLGLGRLADLKSGGIVSRLSSDCESVSGLVQMAIISPGVAGIRVILTIAILTRMSWRLAVATMVLMPPLGLASYLWLRKVRPIYRSIRQDYTHIDARVAETFGGVRIVRAFRRESREGKAYALGHHTVIRKSLRATRLELVLEAVWGMIIPSTTLLLVWYGATLVRAGQASVGSIFAFQIYAVLLLQPVWQIVQSVSQTQRSLAAMERIFGVLQEPADMPDVAGAQIAPAHVHQLELRNVDFSYRTGIPVIRDLSLLVRGGQTVALVGPSGAGKTTLTDLVARFYDPTNGAILLNGTDIRRLQLISYRRLLAVVQQDTFLFDGTVAENIAYGCRGVSREEIVTAARRANADGFVSALPEGYDTLVGERGIKLSGGQRQRISIARAILADPQILILDEATSALDTESEQLIQAALNELLRNRTTFVIAHRLSTVSHADLIVVIDNGQAVETGSHDELLLRRGMYYEMVERQRRSMDGTIGENGAAAVDGAASTFSDAAPSRP